MATISELQANLAEARQAYHNLMTGSLARVVVDQNGERVEFTAANSIKLAQYIQSLERQISGKSNNRPARPYF